MSLCVLHPFHESYFLNFVVLVVFGSYKMLDKIDGLPVKASLINFGLRLQVLAHRTIQSVS